MSESGSDLDFESADEDSEFISEITENKPIDTKTETIVDQDSKDTDLEPEKKLFETTSESKCQKQNDCTSKFARSKNAAEEANLNKETTDDLQSNSSLQISTDKILDFQNEVEKPSDLVDIASEITSSQESKQCDSESLQKTKQRVPLRLEKKRQKCLEVKEKTPIREQKSDLVNILQDSNNEKFSSWGFSSWGTTLLSTAASSVSSFSTQVSQGIGTVLETVESSLGAPSPEELATALSEKAKEKDNFDENIHGELKPENLDAKSSLFFDVSSWTTKVLENTGSKVLMGGLDTLELIGKKGMDILTVGDPGLRKKRSAFGDGTNLSQILREAKARADEQDNVAPKDKVAVHFSQVFDENQGLVHLEALEMLSRQSQAKLQRLLMRHSKNEEVKMRLEEIRSICENIPSLEDSLDCENFEDFESVFKKHALDLNLSLNLSSIIRTQRKINDILCEYESAAEELQESVKEVYESAICCLAEFTAKCIETFHKVTELILVTPPLNTEMESCATNLTGLTTVMCIETNNLSTRFHKHMDVISGNLGTETENQTENLNVLVTNLYVEAENSNKYIQDAYQMLIPVLQECLLENLN